MSQVRDLPASSAQTGCFLVRSRMSKSRTDFQKRIQGSHSADPVSLEKSDDPRSSRKQEEQTLLPVDLQQLRRSKHHTALPGYSLTPAMMRKG